MLKFFICNGLLLALCAESGFGASLRGFVPGVAPSTPGRASISPYPATLGALEAGSTAGPTNGGFVYLADRRNPGSTQTHELRQRGQRFHPNSIAVPLGSRVEFPNDDPIYHNVFSYSKTKRFDLGRYGKGKSKSVLFDKAGVVRVFCDVHSDMSATIVVVDSDYIAEVAPDGAFRMDEIPEGRHTLVHWSPQLGERRWPIEITSGHTDLRLEP